MCPSFALRCCFCREDFFLYRLSAKAIFFSFLSKDYPFSPLFSPCLCFLSPSIMSSAFFSPFCQEASFLPVERPTLFPYPSPSTCFLSREHIFCFLSRSHTLSLLSIERQALLSSFSFQEAILFPSFSFLLSSLSSITGLSLKYYVLSCLREAGSG